MNLCQLLFLFLMSIACTCTTYNCAGKLKPLSTASRHRRLDAQAGQRKRARVESSCGSSSSSSSSSSSGSSDSSDSESESKELSSSSDSEEEPPDRNFQAEEAPDIEEEDEIQTSTSPSTTPLLLLYSLERMNGIEPKILCSLSRSEYPTWHPRYLEAASMLASRQGGSLEGGVFVSLRCFFNIIDLVLLLHVSTACVR